MLFNVMVPEFILSKALVEFLSARDGTKSVLAFQSGEKHDDEVDWTATHTHFANMGGVFVKFDCDAADPSLTGGTNSSSLFIKQLIRRCEEGYPGLGTFDWAVHRAHYKMAKKWLDEHNETAVDRAATRALIGDVWVLSCSQLLEARKLGVIEKFPHITKAQIDDRNKGDGLVKCLAVIQVLWLIIQLIIRATGSRRSSQIEITALAFAVCALITYLLLLPRPKDVNTPIVVNAVRDVDYEEFCRIVRLSQTMVFNISFSGNLNYTIPTATRPYIEEHAGTYLTVEDLGLYGGLSVFGAIHLVAWNFDYPNDGERLAWRVSALIVTILPIIFGGFRAGAGTEVTWANAGFVKRYAFYG